MGGFAAACGRSFVIDSIAVDLRVVSIINAGQTPTFSK
jgi:hypothetical protein